MHETTQALGRIERKLDAVLRALYREGKTIMSTLDDLKAQVTQTETVEASAVQLIQGLAQKLQDALDNNPNSATQAAAIAEIVAELKQSGDALAGAVTANTAPPPAPAPASPPAPPPAGGGQTPNTPTPAGGGQASTPAAKTEQK